MDAKRWMQIKEIYDRALDLGRDGREGFLAEACAGDDDLRREVESLLAAHEDAGTFLQSPAVEVAARDIVADEITSPAAQLIGRELANYKIVSLLGRGGMGEVYLAEDKRLHRKVALKLLPARFTNDAERVRRFVREASAASATNHPNILTIHEIGDAEGAHYIVSEFVEGQTLRALIERGRLGVSEAMAIAEQVAGALSVAHEAGIIHRDIKPENVMVRSDGLVKVLDFGLAKLSERHAAALEVDTQAETLARLSTEPGIVMGTVSYMSPEQARGQKVDHRTDIFSLGVTLYEMLAGRLPFEGATASDMIASILRSEPPPLAKHSPQTPAELEAIVMKALAKDREARWPKVEDLADKLREISQELDFKQRLADSDKKRLSSVSVAAVKQSEQQPVWGSEFTHTGADLFALQSSIAEQVTVALALKLTGEERQRLDRRYTENTEAYQLYLQGRYFLHKRTTEGIRRAIEYFDQAIARDSRYAPAYVDLGLAWSRLAERNLVPMEEGPSKAKAAVSRALEIDDSLGEAHSLQAFLRLIYDWDVSGAERELQRALELDPNNAMTLQWQGVYLMARGRADEAVSVTRRAVELDPVSLNARSQLCRALYLGRRYDEAIATSQEVIQMDANYASAWAYLGQSYAQKRMGSEAVGALQKADSLGGVIGEIRAALGHAYAAAGRRDEAQKVIADLKTNPNRFGVPYHLVTVYAALGQTDEAINWLTIAFDRHDPLVINRVRTDPKLDQLRNDPRFNALLQRFDKW